MALGMGECREVVRAAFVEKMVKGVGTAPREEDGVMEEEEQGGPQGK